jgi:hypothetical protein
MTRNAATITVPEAAALLGIARNVAYQHARTTGQLAGIPVIRVGPRRLVVPRAPLEELLGINTTEDTDDAVSSG